MWSAVLEDKEVKIDDQLRLQMLPLLRQGVTDDRLHVQWVAPLSQEALGSAVLLVMREQRCREY